MEKIGRIAIRMADANDGAIFAIVPMEQASQNKYNDILGQLPITLNIASLRNLTDDEIINFAKEDGAVIIGNRGEFITFRAILKSDQECQIYEAGAGSRHVSTQNFSKLAECICIVVSQDGTITLFMDGEKIFRI
jgi:DNA integrity scanning protein DisA with diadenylate cyclase activity